MPDPRNIAHDKKVMDEKKHDGEDIDEGTVNAPQPGKKPAMEKDDDETTNESEPGADGGG
jgi:hypothetical protein